MASKVFEKLDRRYSEIESRRVDPDFSPRTAKVLQAVIGAFTITTVFGFMILAMDAIFSNNLKLLLLSFILLLGVPSGLMILMGFLRKRSRRKRVR